LPSDAFWEEWLATSPETYLDACQKRLLEFSPDARPEAVAQLMRAAQRTLGPEETEEEEPELLPMQEFLERTGDPPPHLVEEILPAKKLIAFAGLPKEGKSLVALQMLQDVCEGKTMLSRFQVNRGEPAPVIYFAMEEGRHELKRLLMLRGRTDLLDYFVCADSFDMRSEEGWARFMRLTSVVKDPALLILDTAREAYHGIHDWNDAAEITPILRRLRLWAHQHCTVLLVCHTNKNMAAQGVNKVAGSGAFISVCDGVAMLEDKQVLDTGGLRWRYSTWGRSIRSVEFLLEMDTNTLAVRCLTEEEVAATKQLDRTKQRTERKESLMRFARQKGRFVVSEMSRLLGLSQQYTRELVQELIVARELVAGDMVNVEGVRQPVPSYRLPDLFG
jgi:hypothetical protein